jgi:hypothetical protein
MNAPETETIGMGDLVDERLARSIGIVAEGYGLERLPGAVRDLRPVLPAAAGRAHLRGRDQLTADAPARPTACRPRPAVGRYARALPSDPDPRRPRPDRQRPRRACSLLLEGGTIRDDPPPGEVPDAAE